ncbi:MAG: C39 family peptidase [Verrucomicrobiota bacterium]
MNFPMTPMKRLLVFLCCTSAALAQTPKATPAPLDPLLTAPTVWEAPQFVENNGTLGFRWLSVAKDSAQSTLQTATLFGQPVCQTLVRFDQGKPKEITALFYNRGDMGEIMRITYEKLVQDLIAAISASLKTVAVPRGRDATNAVKVDGVAWNTPASTYLLEYSCTKTPQIPFRAEFVRLRITPVEKPKSLLERSFAESKKEVFSGPKHVFHDVANGDVLIKDIPMIDQGQKGYCVVATAARVLRYYGIKVDENELAQLANSSASRGTNLQAMTDSLKKLAARFTIHVRTIYEIDYRGLMADYDQIARRSKASPLNPNVQDAGGLYDQMKPEVLREARIKNHSGLSAFQRRVKEHVDTGIPVLWSVILGMIPDGSKAKMPGGHMRLIIGYNEKTDEILYSDSWGIGHELKRMPAADAWVITTTTGSVEPL